MVLKWKINSFESNKFLGKTQSSIIYVQKVLYRNFIPLHSWGLKATYYHGGLTSRERIKHAWMDDTQVVATNAFGMGIDKADVKTVIHINFRKHRKLLSRSRSIWQKWKKSICGSNESF
jgi:ATP-dependent DNA helicase RecQ